MDLDYALLGHLTQIFGPSGSEERVADFLAAQLRPFCDELKTDTLGNLIVERHGIGKKIMVAAHMDEIGLMITHLDKEGFLRFTPLGGVRIPNLVGQRVKFSKGRIGTIGVEKLDKPSDFKLDKLYLDIGVASREEAEQLVSIGETAVFVGDFVESEARIISKALDDRIGCFVAMEALKRTKSTHELAFVFTVQEEIGTRGAQTAAYALEPDLAIAVDVTLTGDTPKAHPMSVKLGSGVGIKVLDHSMITSPQIKRWMAAVATDLNIPFQWEVLEYGGTDSGAIHLSRGGVPSGVLSIPTRYVHSPAEMLDKRDVEAAVNLLVALLERPTELMTIQRVSEELSVPIGQNHWEKPLKDLLLQELERSGYSEISLFLFGSRAEGTAAAVSDIDIGLKGEKPLPFHLLSYLHEKIDELNLPLKVDLVDFQKVSAEFAEHAMKGAIVWKN